ncbi:MAG TPA: polysaccharide deacetylase family protein [Gemmatimonadaceae bacterium]
MTTPGCAKVIFFWDYDTQWGADRSRNPNRKPDWGALEFPNTDLILDAHAEYAVPACFAVVGAAALPGERPYHDPAQIRRIHEAGHEVGSHAFRHEWLPALGGDELRETLTRSKSALEQCIGAEVTTFVPPFNQPFDYARAMSFSISERRAVRRDRIDVGRLCDTLRDVGYAFCRLAYRPLALRMMEALSRREIHRPGELERIGGVWCLRVNTPCGFGEETRALIERHLDRGEGGYWVMYGHPHSAGDRSSSQSLDRLRTTLEAVSRWRSEGRVECVLPRELSCPELVA